MYFLALAAQDKLELPLDMVLSSTSRCRSTVGTFLPTFSGLVLQLKCWLIVWFQELSEAFIDIQIFR